MDTAQDDALDNEAEQPEKPAKASKRAKKVWRGRLLRLAIVLFVVAGLAGGVYAWWRTMSKANYGTIDNSASQAQSTESSKPVEYTVLDLQKVQLSYPTYFKVQTNQHKQSNLLDYRVLTAPTTQTNDRAQIGITLKNITVPLADDSAYRFYTDKRSTYDIQTQTIQGEPVQIVSKRSEFERTMFWQHKGMVLVVVITAPTDPGSALAEQSQHIFKSVAWQ